MLERGDHVSFANCGLPYYVGGEIASEESLLVQTPESLAASLALDVRTRHEVVRLDAAARTVIVRTEDGEERIEFDALVLSPGATALRPPIPGLDSSRVRTLRTVEDALALRERVETGARRAVVLGAGFIGIEAAEAFAQQGLETTVVELASHVLPPLDEETAWFVAEEVQRLGIVVHTGVAAAEIVSGPESDVVVLANGTRLDADIIVLSVGVRPDTDVFAEAGVATERGAILIDEHGRTNLENVWAVGDATVSTDLITGIRRPVALAGPANRAGRLVADDMCGLPGARPIPHPLGTAIVRVGALTVAMTGANRHALEESGIAFHTLHLHPNQHAGYFPGARQIHLSVHVRTVDGALLGAQAVGEEGIDKRIDVLATAIRAAMTVDELIDLDLSYSPPYGQAKDPVNLAGMVGANVQDGTLRIWDARDLDSVADTALILDVRTDAEVATGILPGALHIPHTELRTRLNEVRSAAEGRPVRVMCASGVRSAIAHRVLAQAGFDSASLAGGMLTLRAVLADRAEAVLCTPPLTVDS